MAVFCLVLFWMGKKYFVVMQSKITQRYYFNFTKHLKEKYMTNNAETESIPVTISTIESTSRSGWYLLEGTLPEDVIFCRNSFSGILRHSVMLLQTADEITWWKSLELVRHKTSEVVASVFTQDANHGPNEFDYGITAFDSEKNYTLYISKAKEFGIHRRMYHMVGEDVFKTIEFFWEKDW